MALKLRRSVVVLTTIAVFATSCSGSSDAEPVETTASTTIETTTPEQPATDAAVTDPPASDPPTTDPPTTEPPATEPPATDPPPTDPPVVGSAEEEVAAAVEFFETQWKTCLNALPNCDLDSVVERRSGEDNTGTFNTAAEYNSFGYTAEEADLVDYRVRSLTIEGEVATVAMCIEDGVHLIDDAGIPVDERFLSSNQTWTFVRDVDGSWQLDDRQLDGELVEGQENSLCVAV